jgi:hypothetical protein
LCITMIILVLFHFLMHGFDDAGLSHNPKGLDTEKKETEMHVVGNEIPWGDMWP